MGSARRPAASSRQWRRCSGPRAGWVQILASALKPGARLVREWHGRTHTVTVTEDGFEYAGASYASLTKIAKKITGAHWSGPRFFGLVRGRHKLGEGDRQCLSRKKLTRRPSRRLRCAIYTRKSSDEGLEQAFNSLDAQREACAAFILSQKHEGWTVLPALYDDGGYSGGTMERPALQRLLADIADGKVDVVVVYKVDRLTRSLFDFAKIVEVFDAPRRLLRLDHAAVQHHHQHGTADPQRPVCPLPSLSAR